MNSQIWMSGVNFVPQSTEQNDPGGNRGLLMVPTRYGMDVRQLDGTENDFHLSIPSFLDRTKPNHPDSIRMHSGYLRVQLFPGTLITSIHATEILNTGLFVDVPCVPKNFKFPVSSTTVGGDPRELNLDYPDWVSRGPMCLSLHLSFVNGGRIFLFGAGTTYSDTIKANNQNMKESNGVLPPF